MAYFLEVEFFDFGRELNCFGCGGLDLGKEFASDLLFDAQPCEGCGCADGQKLFRLLRPTASLAINVPRLAGDCAGANNSKCSRSCANSGTFEQPGFSAQQCARCCACKASAKEIRVSAVEVFIPEFFDKAVLGDFARERNPAFVRYELLREFLEPFG